MCKSNGFIIPADRQNKILDYIQQNGSGKITDLADLLGVSEATIRRDLIDLSHHGLVERMHGGAVAVNRGTTLPEYRFNDRMDLEPEKKKAIGIMASKYIHDGDAFFLDAGTTGYQIAANLSSYKYITLITNDLFIASTIVLHPTSSLIITGGVKREGFNVLTGSLTEDFIRNIKVKTAFLSCDCVDIDWGISAANFLEAESKKCLIEAADEIVLVCDSSKFGKKAIAKVSDISSVNKIITDDQLSPYFQALLTEKRIPFTLAEV